MYSRSHQRRIVNYAMNCLYCRPLSGCPLCDLRGATRQETTSRVNSLCESELYRLIDFHESCPYQHKLAL